MEDLVCSSADIECLSYLRILQELHEKKQQLQECVSSGFFAMSKARYVMGVQRVSSLHYAPIMKADTTVSLEYDKNGDPSFEVCIKQLNSMECDTNDKNTLKKRMKEDAEESQESKEGETVPAIKNSISEVISDDADLLENPSTDPINWFGVLVPQTLRQSQAEFRRASIIAGEICSLQVKLKEMHRNIQGHLGTAI